MAIVGTQHTRKNTDDQRNHNNHAADHHDDDEHDDPATRDRRSPESAGLVRGASNATARALAKRSAVGRLPATAGTTTTATATAATSAASRAGRGGGRAVAHRVRHPHRLASAVRRRRAAVARTSDRVSTGMDVVSAGVETGDGISSSSWRERGRRVAAFGGALVKSTILGAAVFETYEGAIQSWAPTRTSLPLASGEEKVDVGTERELHIGAAVIPSEKTATDSLTDRGDSGGDEDEGSSSDDAFERASVPLHFLAGGAAGSVHGVLAAALDTVSISPASSFTKKEASSDSNGLKQRRQRPFVSFVPPPSMAVVLSSTLHHASAHAVLFGSYEWIKRGLLRWSAGRGDDVEEGGEERIAHGEGTDVTRSTMVGVVRHPDDSGGAAFAVDDNDGPTKSLAVDSTLPSESRDINGDGIDSSSTGFGEGISSDLLAIGAAGGFAGQLQHITSHYTEAWLRVDRGGVRLPFLLTGKPSPVPGGGIILGSIGGFSSFVRKWFASSPPPPTLRSTLLAFPPAGIGFIAFEYAKDIVSGGD